MSPAAWVIPSPDTVLAWLVAHDEVLSLLEQASTVRDPVPVSLHYGPVRGDQPDSSVPYRLIDDNEAPPWRSGSVYVIVLYADIGRVLVQVGRPDPIEVQPGAFEAAEDGFQMNWIRTNAGWDGGTIMDRWSRPSQPALSDSGDGARMAEPFAGHGALDDLPILGIAFSSR